MCPWEQRDRSHSGQISKPVFNPDSFLLVLLFHSPPFPFSLLRGRACVCVHPQKHLLSSVGFIINDEFGLAASFTQGSSFAFGLIRACSSTARVAWKCHPRQGVRMPQKPSRSQGAKQSREAKRSLACLQAIKAHPWGWGGCAEHG